MKFPEDLPISAAIREIAEAVFAHPVVIVAGETGSGKTTQLPKLCLAMGRGLEKRIGVTQPRRIAATSVAARVAEELQVELGREVGYQIRFANKTSAHTYVKFMTDGILLAELSGDPQLLAYDTLIIDEAHERTLNIDFLLGVVKGIVKRRSDLRVIISSATLETDRFAKFFDDAPVIQVSGRTFPVETIYRPKTPDENDLAEAIANTVEELSTIDPRGDILVFLPGEREITETMHELTQHALPRTTLLPLYGRLSQAEQARVFQRIDDRRIVLATNIAETSLTIDGIVFVIDAGLARLNRYAARTGVTQLLVEPIAQASANQRKGRAGRTRSGVCFRMYEEADFDLRPAYTDPELLRVGLAGAILQMKSLGLGEIRSFPFLDPPPKRSVDEGYRVLEELGAIDDDGALTDIGRKLSRLPVDPRIGRMILGGEAEGALDETLVIAAALGVQDPRERPLAAQQKADMAHRRFRDETSDFGSLLKLWRYFQEDIAPKSQSVARRLCREQFLSFTRMREWRDIHQQLLGVAKDLGFRVGQKPASEEAVHKAILPGLLSRIAMWHAEDRVYLGARQTRFQLHPSSGLAKKPPAWIVAAELVETSRLFGRTAARIDPTWLEAAAGPLCRRSYGEPSYAERQAQVMIKEHVTLYGLPIVKDRRVHFGPIDPPAARRIFLIHALVRQEYAPSPEPPFIAHNRSLFLEVKRLRDKARRSDMVADDDAVALFFDRCVGEDVYSGKTFEAWRAVAEAKDPRVLFLSLGDILLDDADDLSAERFPDTLRIGAATIPLSYRFAPGEEDDGITLTLPVALLPALDPAILEWTIPGWQADKIALLCDNLPKVIRKELGARHEMAELFRATLRPFETPFIPSLCRAIFELSGHRVNPDALPLDLLPPHLRFYFRVMDGKKVLGEGRDLGQLQERFGLRVRDVWEARKKSKWEREGLTKLVDALPTDVKIDVDGIPLTAFPALVDTGAAVDQKLFPSREEADVAMRGGLRRLFLLRLGTSPKKLEEEVPARVAMSGLAHGGAVGPRKQLVDRAIDEAFGLSSPARFPRDPAAFEKRFLEGKVKLTEDLRELGKLAQGVALAFDKVRAALGALAGKPSLPKASVDDIRSQLEHLVSREVLVSTSRARLAHLPRYLRAIEVRLERMPNGPQKDLAKAEQLGPFWRDWLAHRDRLRTRGVSNDSLEEFRFLVEEFRVSVFAPELKTPVSLSRERLAEAWRTLAG